MVSHLLFAILTLPTSTLSLLDQSKTSRILSVLSFPKLRIVRGCLVLGYGPLRPQQGSRQDAPRLLGTSRSEEEFQAYRSILTAGQPADKATQAESFLQQFPDSGLRPFVQQAAVIDQRQLYRPA